MRARRLSHTHTHRDKQAHHASDSYQHPSSHDNTSPSLLLGALHSRCQRQRVSEREIQKDRRRERGSDRATAMLIIKVYFPLEICIFIEQLIFIKSKQKKKIHQKTTVADRTERRGGSASVSVCSLVRISKGFSAFLSKESECSQTQLNRVQTSKPKGLRSTTPNDPQSFIRCWLSSFSRYTCFYFVVVSAVSYGA